MLALPAVAQDRTGTWEISPFAGGYFGGRLYGNYTVPFTSGTVSGVRFLEPDDDLAYGARLAYNVTRHFGFEVDWTSSRADLRSPDFFGSVPRNFKVGTLRQNVYEANGLFNFGRRRVIGYIGIGAGAAVLKRTSRASIRRRRDASRRTSRLEGSSSSCRASASASTAVTGRST